MDERRLDAEEGTLSKKTWLQKSFFMDDGYEIVSLQCHTAIALFR